VGAALDRVLATAADAMLQERYATRVQRTRRVLRHQGARIELALDEGEIRAGGLRLALCELEFELLQGPPQALLALAGRWVQRFGLVLDVRSKSELGHRLAAAAAAGASAPAAPPTPARPLKLKLHAHAAPQAAGAAIVAQALEAVLANASVLADTSAASGAEHLHQLRVGLRRLRSLLRSAPALWPDLPPSLLPALAVLFDRLGAARDRDVAAQTLLPALHAAGAPLAEPPAKAVEDPAAALREPATQQLWLDLLALTLAPPPTAEGAASGASRDGTRADAGPSGTASPTLPVLLAPPLQRLLRQVRRDARCFAALDDDARHRLRRRIKRLRYALEAGAALWPGRRSARLLRRLQRAQEALGALNDVLVAHAQWRSLAAVDPRSWFAVGWLAARRELLVADCTRPLARLAEAASPWAGRRGRAEAD
jgi:inorganic triphosphatase YgiF